MKPAFAVFAAFALCASGALAQNPPSPPALPPGAPTPPALPAPPGQNSPYQSPDGASVNTDRASPPAAVRDSKDFIGFGRSVDISDRRAKLFVGAARDVEITNSFFETVLMASGDVEITGGAVDELMIAAWQVSLDLNIDKGAIVAGNVRLGKNTNVRGDMAVNAGSVDAEGNYAGDLKIEADTVRVSGNIGGDLRIDSPRVVIEPGTTIGGDLIAPGLSDLRDGVTVGGEVSISRKGTTTAKREGVTVIVEPDVEKKVAEAKAKAEAAAAKVEAALGDLDISETAKKDIRDAVRDDFDLDFDPTDIHPRSSDSGLISPEPMGMRAWFTVLVTLAACGALALGLAPQFLVRATERLAKEPLPSFGVGIASVVAVPVLALAVSITVIGIPFAVLGVAAYLIGIGLGLIALCLWAGLMVRTLANQPGQETRLSKLVGWTLMGFLALALIGAVPYVGRLVQIVAIITGAGAVLSTAWALRNAKKAQAAAAAT